ncbi:26010_t:CDS:2 [Dentiscutata erythropus]|uniref:26010_t:CDS:1 n=1 Tax=Dentiscutata erythropus TaxID=1348616 RepID=A0A9N9CSH8_9GLOM|nr:26010_t:CDS:2 [Dentiscutata erythropus]
MDRATDLIGKYLLTGWVPLLRSKDSSVWFCVLCEKPENTPINSPQNSLQENLSQNETSNAPNNIEPTILSSQNSTQTHSEVNISIEERREQSRRASQSIGQYLLQGWALIDEVCPNETCFGVNKKRYCVVCQHYYMNESDIDHSKYKISRDLAPQTSTLSSNRSVFNEEKRKVYAKDTENIATNSFSNNNNNEAINTAQKAIIAKLEELSARLQDTIDISEVKSICDAMKSCAQALEALGALD